MSTSRSNGRDGSAATWVKAIGLGTTLALSAYLMAVAIQSPTVWWLGWVTLLPLMLAIRVLRPTDALLAGSFWGICFYAVSLTADGALFAPASSRALLLWTVPGIYAFLGAAVTRRIGFSPLLIGLGWVGVEFALCPLAMENGLLAGTLGVGAGVRLAGNLVGYVLVAFLVAFVAASLLSVLTEVCVGVVPLRPVRSSSEAQTRLHALEASFDLRHFIHPSRPRGPPRSALIPLVAR